MREIYVLGFLFSPITNRVALIKKNRPRWQEGMLNGIGGKVNDKEWPFDAMIREFEEETGVHEIGWVLFHEIIWPGYICYCYKAFSINIDKVKTCTDELIQIVNAYSLPINIVSNVRWLIPLAVDIRPPESSKSTYK
jgi:8-oxo-dGTP diphosphatase